MSEAEIEAHRRADVTWHRPTWRFGSIDHGAYQQFADPFDFFGGGATADGAAGPDRWPPPGGGARTREMMAVLGLDAAFTLGELKQRYKALAKRHHPDLNPGDHDADNRLKRINEAYTYLVANRIYV